MDQSWSSGSEDRGQVAAGVEVGPRLHQRGEFGVDDRRRLFLLD